MKVLLVPIRAPTLSFPIAIYMTRDIAAVNNHVAMRGCTVCTVTIHAASDGGRGV